ncbi:MAG: hypothetical protein JWR09_1950 [Mucilaginibacter sp.]|nr:hypothetical protein [Mucilaginibacter sp.]
MKKYLLLILAALIFIIGGCSKKADVNPPVIPITPEVSVQSISYPSFINSTWNNVNGGKVAIKFDKVNDKDSVLSTTNDSTNFTSLSTYSKILGKGTYDITVSSKNITALADTFIRFNAKIKSYLVENKQAVALTATSNDGLITIGQSFIQDNTVPVFKTDSGGITYKMGLANGFYYLYIRGGVKGSISFKSKASGQSVTKTLNVVTLNQLNMEVVTNKGPLTVVFTNFTYNQVTVISSTLITLHISPGVYVGDVSTYFVATDENGTILNEVKYIPGTSTFKIASTQPYEKARFNFYEVRLIDGDTKPSIIGYLQIKKGSSYFRNPAQLPYKDALLLTPHLKNANTFDKLSISTDFAGVSFNSPSDASQLSQLNYSAGSKLWVQLLKNNEYKYTFFDLPNGTTDFNVDLNQLTKSSISKTITAPSGNLQVDVVAKSDKDYLNGFDFGMMYSQDNTLNYYYPTEKFVEYDTRIIYTIGNFNYYSVTSADFIPSKPADFNATLTYAGSTMKDFVPSFTGTFDYYHAAFQNTPSTPNLSIDLYSPSAANYTHIKLPDFSKYLGMKNFDMTNQKLDFFEIEQCDGFDETQPFYKSVFGTGGYNSKAIQYFNIH